MACDVSPVVMFFGQRPLEVGQSRVLSPTMRTAQRLSKYFSPDFFCYFFFCCPLSIFCLDLLIILLLLSTCMGWLYWWLFCTSIARKSIHLAGNNDSLRPRNNTLPNGSNSLVKSSCYFFLCCKPAWVVFAGGCFVWSLRQDMWGVTSEKWILIWTNTYFKSWLVNIFVKQIIIVIQSNPFGLDVSIYSRKLVDIWDILEHFSNTVMWENLTRLAMVS